MRLIREIEVGGRKVQVRELTVGEIRKWFAELAAQAGKGADAIDQTLLEDLSLSELKRMADLDDAAIDNLTPSEINEVVAVAREVNTGFFAQRRRIAAIGRELLALQGVPQPVPSSS